MRVACSKKLEKNLLKECIVSNLKVEVVMLAPAQKGTYLYQAVKEALKNGKIRWFPERLFYDTRVIYRSIRTQWPQMKSVIIRRFNFIKKKIVRSIAQQGRTTKIGNVS